MILAMYSVGRDLNNGVYTFQLHIKLSIY